ncbi:hypothetical protein D9M71_285130 [compost metagenome]
MQARRLAVAPLQDAAGEHRQQAAVVADQGQLQVFHALVGGRTGEQLVEGVHRFSRVDALDALADQRSGRIAELVALGGGNLEQASVGGNAVGQQESFFRQQE